MAGKVMKATTGLDASEDDGKLHPHPQVEDLVNTIGFSLVQELVQYLQRPDGAEALEVILDTQTRCVSNLAATKEARQATRVMAQEFVMGSYDAVERRWLAVYKHKRAAVPFLAALLLGYVFLLALGGLLSCWRFAFYGLH